MVSPVSQRTSPSDALLQERIRRQLLNSDRIPFRQVGVSVRDGRVRLTGRLGSWYLKQLAQATVMEVEGVTAVDNEVVVS